MRFAAVLNREGGTLRTTDLDALAERMRGMLEARGHRLEIDIVGGGEISAALAEVAGRRGVDVVLAGGGDGTISTAAAALVGSGKALAVLPAGTMNLFARGLGIPTALDAALASFAGADVATVDVATANGRIFVHQFSIGMHARMVRLRESMEFGSRLGKMRASVQAAWRTINSPRAMQVAMTIGEAEITARTTGIGITNNLFGENHLPYADDPAGGVLGIYVTMTRQRGELMRFFFNMARGRWRDNPHVEIHQTDKAVLEIGALWWGVTIGLVVLLLAIDLVVAAARPHRVGFREAVLWSLFYIAVAVAFGVVFWMTAGAQFGTEFFAGYIVEKSLSVDNLFNARQRVTDANGVVPISYQPDLVDPRGRVIGLEFRKQF